MGCCVQRSKFEGNQDEMFRTANMLPTYENINAIYEELMLPIVIDEQVPQVKEKLIYMIINLMRVKPAIFMHQINMLKIKCDMRQKPKNLVYFAEDVDLAIDYLLNLQPMNPLELSPELCAYSR